MQPKYFERLFWVSGWIYDFSKIATVLLIVGLLTHYFFFTVLVVRGKSMEPSYVDGQVLLVNKINYRYAPPQRGDVVAMFFPGETERRFIKRVIAMPGERIKITEGNVFINDQPLVEPYLDTSVLTSAEIERTLQTGEFFVMGDNRSNSSDSRAWGAVPRSFIIGRVSDELLQLPSSAQANLPTGLGDSSKSLISAR